MDEAAGPQHGVIGEGYVGFSPRSMQQGHFEGQCLNDWGEEIHVVMVEAQWYWEGARKEYDHMWEAEREALVLLRSYQPLVAFTGERR